MARRSMLVGLQVLVAMVGIDTPLARRQLAQARITLADAGFLANTDLAPGEPEQVQW